MSVEAMALVLHHSRSTGTPKVVLLGIANHDGDGGAWPTIETLCKYANRRRSTVQSALRALEELGELRVHVNGGGNQDTRDDRRPNRYEIVLACPDACDGTTQHRVNGVQDSGRRERHGVQDSAPRGPESEPNGVQDSGPEPSLEPPTNHPRDDALFATEDQPRAKARPRDPIWDGLAAVYPVTTRAEASRMGKVVKELRALDPEPSEDLSRRAAHAIRVRYPDSSVMAIPNHWSWALEQPGVLVSQTDRAGPVDPPTYRRHDGPISPPTGSR